MVNMPEGSLSLRHVGVSPGSLDDFCQIMEKAFQLKVQPDGAGRAIVNLGKERLLVTDALTGSPTNAAKSRVLDHLALATPSPEHIAERLSAAGLPAERYDDGRRTTFILPPDAWSGVPIQLSEDDDVDTYVDPDRNILGIDHIGVASGNNDVARQRFCDLLGLPVESVQTDTEATFRVEQFTSDKYGVRVASSQASPVTGLRVMFVTLGTCEFEFLQDLGANADAPSSPSGSTAGDQGAIASFVQRQGQGLHHIALQVQDISTALQQAEAGGVQLIDRVGRPGSRRAQIAFMHPRSTGGVLFHFVQREGNGTAETS